MASDISLPDYKVIFSLLRKLINDSDFLIALHSRNSIKNVDQFNNLSVIFLSFKTESLQVL